MSRWLLQIARPLTAVCIASVLACSHAEETKSSPPKGEENRPAAGKPTAPLIEKKVATDWCKEHGVPESVCTRCNASLIADFKKRGDWCAKHDLPDSQCVACHPELKAKLDAMAPKSDK